MYKCNNTEKRSGRTPQLCSPLTAMLNRPTTHPKMTDLYTWC